MGENQSCAMMSISAMCKSESFFFQGSTRKGESPPPEIASLSLNIPSLQNDHYCMDMQETEEDLS